MGGEWTPSDGRSITTNSIDGIHVGTAPFFSLGDNGIYANVTDVLGSLSSLAPK